MTFQDIPFNTITGETTSLAAYRGKVALIVNVASKCGLTPQYDALEKVYNQYRDRDFVVLGFPSNDFLGQEPGTDQDIQQFCTLNFDVHFPMFSKIRVVGDEKHPLYSALITAQPTAQAKPGSDFRGDLKGYGISTSSEPEVLWNFEKFLVDKTGQVVARFSPDIAPDDAIVIDVIERLLAVGKNG